MGLKEIIAGRQEESGLTLVEMAVVLIILSVVLTMTLRGLTAVSSTASGADRRLQNLDEARIVMNNLSKDLRTAVALTPGTPAFLVASANETTFYANLNPVRGPVKVHLYIDTGKRLVREIMQPDNSSVAPNFTYTGASTTRILGTYVVNSTSSPIFTFYDATGTVLTTPLSDSARLSVRSIDIVVIIQKPGGKAPASTLVTRVRLPNAYYNAA